MGNIDDDIRRTSLRIDEKLAVEVDKLALKNVRSFNNQLLILIKKGITLVEAEKLFLEGVNPVMIVKSAEQ